MTFAWVPVMVCSSSRLSGPTSCAAMAAARRASLCRAIRSSNGTLGARPSFTTTSTVVLPVRKVVGTTPSCTSVPSASTTVSGCDPRSTRILQVTPRKTRVAV